MAYQKLQAGRAWQVYKSDNTNLPDTGLRVFSSVQATTAHVAGGTEIINTNRTLDDLAYISSPDGGGQLTKFTLCGIKLGMIVVNTTDGTQSTVTAVTDTIIYVKENIFTASPKNFNIYGGTQEGAVLYVGTAGNLRVTTIAGDDVIFSNINTGAFIPVNVLKVWNTNTTADNIVALW
jgi:hypothetical protein|tara:strand:- start:736 stop:1269 length:534 start_codon:yes stop_codon:yes gene_type:complete